MSTAEKAKRHAITAIKFIFLAVPGGFLLVLGILLTCGELLGQAHPNRTKDLIVFPIAAALGFPMTLYGLDRWGQWRYIYVFLSIPVSMLVLGMMHFVIIDGKLDVVFAAVPPLIVYRLVKKSYGNAA